MRLVAARMTVPALPGWPRGRRSTAFRPGRGAPPPRRAAALARAVLAALISVVVLAVSGALAPAARADGDPGSDVLVYQDLFLPADAGVSVQQQVQLGDLLKSARQHGFTIRVAVIAQPDDLGAVTALWRKPAAYARFLGIELSLAYKQRLLIVMPNGFGFNWPGRSSADAYRLLSKVPVGHGGSGLAAAAESAVRKLAVASGVTIPAAAGAAASAAPVAPVAPSPVPSARGAAPGGPAASAGSAGPPAPLLLAIVLAAAFLVIAAGWLALRRGWRLPYRRRGRAPAPARDPAQHSDQAPHSDQAQHSDQAPRGKPAPARMPRWLRRASLAAWLTVPVAIVAAAAVMMHAVTAQNGTAPGGTARGKAGSAARIALASNPHLDPGTALSGPAPDFTLTDQFGQPVSLRSYRGKVVILAFIDAECTTTCPLTTTAMVDAKAMLGSAGADVQLVGVNANPKATAVMDLQSYSELHGMLHRWHFLTGSLPQLKSVWKAYSVGVEISQNLINHTSAVFVIGPDGKLAKVFMSQQSYASVKQMGQLLAQEASSLLPGHPAVRSHLTYAQVKGISPATATSLPLAGGGTARLGPGKARLYLFFATWDREITSLAGHLDGLGGYESSAKTSGLPPLTAVDEGSIEPSPSALRQFLTTLPHPLSYPVSIDDTGRVADGYQVLGQPWFVLTSPAGKVVWSWEVSTKGWLTPARLARQVRAALARSPA